jgi:hypothetical protein
MPLNPSDMPTPGAVSSETTIAEIQTVGGDIKIIVPANELFRVNNIFREHEYAFPADRLSRPLRVLDVGANVGMFAIYVKLIVPESEIHCFEPVPGTLPLLYQNTAGFDHIHIHPYGLSDHEGKANIHIHPFNSGENSIKRKYSASCHDIPVSLKSAQAGGSTDWMAADRRA